MKIIQAFENFHAFENSGSNKEPDVSGLNNFINKPLLGGYILDIFPNNTGSIGITISYKSGNDQEKLGTIVYWLHDLFWQLDNLRNQKTPADEKLLSEMGEILDSNN